MADPIGPGRGSCAATAGHTTLRMRSPRPTLADSFLQHFEGLPRFIATFRSNGVIIEIFPKRGILFQIDQDGGLSAGVIEQELDAFHVYPNRAASTGQSRCELTVKYFRGRNGADRGETCEIWLIKGE